MAVVGGKDGVTGLLADVKAAVLSRGFAVVPNAVSPDAVAALAEETADALYNPVVVGESTVAPPKITMADPRTWPQDTARRVIETVPCGTAGGGKAADAWRAVTTPGFPGAATLHAALDAVLGSKAWELPPNSVDADRRVAVRHWYNPVSFPEGQELSPALRKLQSALEADAATADTFDWTPEVDAALLDATATTAGSGPRLRAVVKGLVGCTLARARDRVATLVPWTPDEDIRLLEQWNGLASDPVAACAFRKYHLPGRTGRSIRKRLKHLGVFASPLGGAGSPAKRWRAVNRRRILDRGWHIDIGPGFDTDLPRTLAGDRAQGVVVLLALNDWVPGGGGTCFVEGSHRWTKSHLRRLKATTGAFPSHQELNRQSIEWITEALKDGRAGYEHDDTFMEKPEGVDKYILRQVTLKAGDVVIMHPWTVHSGTTNLGSSPRLLANGMARLTEEAFVAAGRRLPLLDETEWEVGDGGTEGARRGEKGRGEGAEEESKA